MNFSELVPYQNAAYSHSGEFLAISNQKQLYVSRQEMAVLANKSFFLDLRVKSAASGALVCARGRDTETQVVS